MTKFWQRVLGAAAVLAGAVPGGSAYAAGADHQGPPNLPVNQTVNGRTGGEAAMTYRFTFPESGALSFVVRSDDDVMIAVSDTFGQDLLGGRGDMDLGGRPGAEQAIVTAGAGQVVDIEISNWDNGVQPFQITAGFVAIAGMEVAPDPGGNPGDAADLILGQPMTGGLDADLADRRDWYRLETPAAGHLCVFTDNAPVLPGEAEPAVEADHGDVILEAFVDGEFRNPLAYSDQDTQGRGTRESFLLAVEAGQVYYFRVSGFGDAARYSICAAMVTMTPAMASR